MASRSTRSANRHLNPSPPLTEEEHFASSKPKNAPIKISLVSKARRASKAHKRHGFTGSNPIAAISVGEGDAVETFYVHKSYLVAFSKYFEAAFNGPYLESSTSQLKLEDVSPAVFSIFVNWVYHQKIEDSAGELPFLPCLVELWLFARYVQAPHLQNEVLEAMEKRSSDIHLEPRIDYHSLYDSTDASCPLRLYVSSLVAISHFRQSTDLEHAQLYPHQLLIDIVNWGNKFKRDRLHKVIKPTLDKFMVDEVENDSALRRIASMPANPQTSTPESSPGKESPAEAELGVITLLDSASFDEV